MLTTTTTESTTSEAAELSAPFQPPPSAATLLPSAKPQIEDIEWLARDEAIVTWQYVDGPPIVTKVTVEYEPADRSVGIMSGGFLADGDAPQSILDDVAESASMLASDERDDWEHDDRGTYADEDYYGGAF